MLTFHCVNFGCRASQADGAAIKKQLLDAGLAEAATAAGSGWVVLNTCTVTSTADAEVRRTIRHIHRAHPGCRILVTGCYAQRAPQEISALPGVALVVGNSHKHDIAEILKGAREAHPEPSAVDSRRSLPRGFPPFGKLRASSSWERQRGGNNVEGAAALSPEPQGGNDLPAELVQLEAAPGTGAQVWVGAIPDVFHFAPVYADDRTRPTLKVQDGCAARCSFCVIPSTRGPSRSLPPDRAVAQVRALEAQGVKEIVLSGINLGGYGKDLQPRASFGGLVERILGETTIARLRISSIEPMDVSRRLIALAAAEPRLARHFHVPLQSGSDRILRRMNRRYWTAQYAERIRALHEALPNGALGADVMAGFPGETEEDFLATVRFVESLPFTYLHVFPFSARPGTPAAGFDGHLNGRIVHERSRRLVALGRAKRRAFLAAQVGRKLSALTLDETRGGRRVAMSSNYLEVLMPLAGCPANHLVDARVERVEGDFLSGVIEGC